MKHFSEKYVEEFISELIPEFGDEFNFNNIILEYKDYLKKIHYYKNKHRLLISQYFYGNKKIDFVLIDNITTKKYLIEVKHQKISGTAYQKIDNEVNNLIRYNEKGEQPIILVLGDFYTSERIDEIKDSNKHNDLVKIHNKNDFTDYMSSEYANKNIYEDCFNIDYSQII